jgi:hypothetical protein
VVGEAARMVVAVVVLTAVVAITKTSALFR